MTFRRRIIVAMVPLFALLVALGGTGTILIYHLGNRSMTILRENYAAWSTCATSTRPWNASTRRFSSRWPGERRNLTSNTRQTGNCTRRAYHNEQHNITLPGEGELVDTLTKLSDRYRRQGDEFFNRAGQPRTSSTSASQGRAGLYGIFREIKDRLGRDSADQPGQHGRGKPAGAAAWPDSSLIWYGGGLAIGIALAVFLVASTIRTILYPIRAVTESAAAIGAGNLDQLVPVSSEDELGQLASAFNAMARQLRDYRQSHKAQLTRRSRRARPRSTPFPIRCSWSIHSSTWNWPIPWPAASLGLCRIEAEDGTPLVWQPPDQLRQPLADVLQNRREYLPEGFDKAVVLQMGEDNHFFLPRILPIRDSDGATVGAAVLLEDITRFRLLDEVKSNLVATVSHELKTPLTSIRLVLHLLLEETIGPLTPKQLELLVDARDNAERLLVMINNLLDLARLEQGRSQLHLRPERPTGPAPVRDRVLSAAGRGSRD